MSIPVRLPNLPGNGGGGGGGGGGGYITYSRITHRLYTK